MDESALQKFDPTMADLQAMVEKTKDLTVTDLEDPEQLAIVRTSRIELKNARVRITKTGKELRDDANKFASAVIKKEKELIAIIEPEEDRLSAIEEEAKKLSLRKERLETLPMKMERIKEYNLDFFHTKTDDEMLEMDNNQFEAYFNELGAMKIDHDKHELEVAEEKKKEREEKERQDEEARIKAKRDEEEEQLRLHREADQKLIDEENARIKKEQDEENARIAKERQDLEDEKKRIADEEEQKKRDEQTRKDTEERILREDKEKKEREEKEEQERQQKLERAEAYQEFLKKYNYQDDGTFKIELIDEGVILYKILGVFKS